jgi:HD-GYP domain-containing protein (c-di-GMP phosphodiesterase class II)
VAALAEALGRHLGLSGQEIEDLAMGALLHDLGRTAIDPAVISRPGPLSPEEWSEMRRHPADGAEVAALAGMPEPVRTAILHHHEFWAGGGFPLGLKGRDIPLFARIIAVADCHDALTSARPHRGPLSPEDVEHHLLTQAGVRYDPEMVQALLTLTSGTAPIDLARSG